MTTDYKLQQKEELAPPNFYDYQPEFLPDKPIGHGAFGIVWAVTDPRNSERVALKKMPHVFQNLVTAKRVFRELRMLCSFRHDNVLSAKDVLLPCSLDTFDELYVLTPLMQSDLHKIIVSNQMLTLEHVKIFTYQILRGLKYLHAADILHRDMKPGNLLVNSNCLLKICDFGLARSREHNSSVAMTQEVVTQYYRPPELLMGIKNYGPEIDMWSVGCILLELLTRRIAFQATNLPQQLRLMSSLLGSPHVDDLVGCDGAIEFVVSQPRSDSKLLATIKSSRSLEDDDYAAFELAKNLLVWNRTKRFSTREALMSRFVSDGRLRFHSCMCSCCRTVNERRTFCADMEPIPNQIFNDSYESSLPSVPFAKESLLRFIRSQPCGPQVPLCINPRSPAFRAFLQSTVAQSSEIPMTPTQWE